MQVSDLEALAAQLNQLRDRLHTTAIPWDEPLAEGSALVQAAQECKFMLPKPLTIGSLAETVQRKLANVAVLLDRARRHEDLPESAQIAADQEYLMTEDDYAHEKRAQGTQEGAQGNP